MTWSEAAVVIVVVVSLSVFLSVFFGVLVTERWPWDRK